MKKRIIIAFILTITLNSIVSSQTIFKKRDLLISSITKEELAEILPAYGEWKPFPLLDDREFWDNALPTYRDTIIKQARELNGTGYVAIKATAYLEYVRTGRREGGGSWQNRDKLKKLVLAEIFENKGEFLDEIINGVWALCEESTWVGSAHLHMQKAGHGLPDVNDPIVDLSVGSTVNFLSWVDYYLGEKFDSISPLIRERLSQEVNKRVLEPCLTRDDFWWMGNGPYLINNWNPWICSNWLMAILIFEKDQQKRVDAVYKTFQIVDKFINFYPDDGGCDEGPSYWYHAGGKLFDYLEIVYSATDSKINLYGDTVIQEIAKYPYRVQIADNQFVNFADAGSKTKMIYYNTETLFSYGERINDSVLMAFAANFAQDVPVQKVFRYKYSMYRFIRYMQIDDKVRAFTGALPYPEMFYFDAREVLVSRDRKGSTEGLFIAAKGGHNNESHNHNDIGNFILYYDGKPVIIDVGVGEYTAKTFSDQRYEIWTMQSQYHNCPTINGVMQKNGEEFRATDVILEKEDGRLNLSMDISKAYPEEAKVEKWERSIEHIKGEEVNITDKFKLLELKDTTSINYMLSQKPEITNNGDIHLIVPGNDSTKLLFNYDKKKWTAYVESVTLEDPHLKRSWEADKLYRLKLVCTKPSKTGKLTVSIFK